MYLKVTKQPNGRQNLSIVHGYRDPQTKKIKHTVVKNLGYVDEYLDQYDDPVAHFRQVAKDMEAQRFSEQQALTHPLGTIHLDERMNEHEDAMKYLGFLPLSRIYHELGLDRFLNSRQRRFKIKYSLSDLLQLLIYTRILVPGSKRNNFFEKDRFPQPFDVTLYEGYRGLDYLSTLKEELMLHTHEQLIASGKRDTRFVFYDVTNFYFETDQEDEFRRKGFCKHNSRKPIVQMGLLLDRDAIPITYQLFPGNTHDSQTMMPTLHEVRKKYQVGRVIVVSDKAMNGGDNIAYLSAENDGFIFSQTIRAAGQSLKDYVLDPKGYQIVENFFSKEELEKEPTLVFRMKSRPYPQSFRVTTDQGTKKPWVVDVKQIVCYNEKYARRQKRKREETIEKARNILKKPSSYSPENDKGALRYIGNIKVDEATGEVIQNKNAPYLNEEQILEDAQWDGYYALITSEYRMKNIDVIMAYHDLWEIERSFRITKTTLESRPVHLTREKRIDAHFMSCFFSLLMLRLLLKRLKDETAPETAVQTLRDFQACHMSDHVYRVTTWNPVIKALGEATGLDLNKRFITPAVMRSWMAETKKVK